MKRVIIRESSWYKGRRMESEGRAGGGKRERTQMPPSTTPAPFI